VAFSNGNGFEHDLEVVVADSFLREKLSLFCDDCRTPRTIDLESIGQARLKVTCVDLSSDEARDFIALCTMIDDSAAQALSLAGSRGLNVLTDDEASIAVADRQGIKVTTTLDLAIEWAKGRERDEVVAACKRLRRQALYPVPRTRPLNAKWYRRHIEVGEAE
jgi:hypothetical protein